MQKALVVPVFSVDAPSGCRAWDFGNGLLPRDIQQLAAVTSAAQIVVNFLAREMRDVRITRMLRGPG